MDCTASVYSWRGRGEIVRSAANLAVTQSRWIGEFVIHTDVDHFDFDAVMSR